MQKLMLWVCVVCLYICPSWAADQIEPDTQFEISAKLFLSDSERQWILQHPQITVAVKNGWMPIEFGLENEKHRGISVDYLQRIADMTGLRFKLAEFHPALEPDQVDMISSVTDRGYLPPGYRRISQRFLLVPYAIYVNRHHYSALSSPKSLSEFSHKKIAIFKSGPLTAFLTNHYPDVTIQPMEIADEAFEALRLGQVDAYIGNEFVVDYHIEYHRLDYAQKIGLAPVQANIGMAVSERSGELGHILEKAIRMIGVNRPEIVDPWRPIVHPSNGKYKVLLGTLIVALLLLVYRFYRMYIRFKQKEQVNKRTIWHQANFDYLTGLPNRYFLQEALTKLVHHARQEAKLVGLILIDLDGFKDVNDTAGHAIGDALLVIVAERLRQCIPEHHTIARLGGDEFIVLAPDCEDSHLLALLAQNLLQVLQMPYQIEGKQFYITGSIGIAIYPDHAQSSEALMMHADQALFAAKHQGKNQYQFFTAQMLKEANDRISLTNDLRVALKHNQFYMHYQPIFDFKTDKLVKVEALLRWQHPVRGEIRPDVFIGLAEVSGLMLELGNRVLDLVLTDIPLMQQTFGKCLMVGINISPIQFLHPEYLVDFIRSLQQSLIPCQSICFEITEHLFLEPSSLVTETIQLIHQAGIRISIDDFGTGYSALAYLKRFPIDHVKIDQSFVKNLGQDKYDDVLCQSIIQMAHQLNITVIAEGVETVSQKQILSKLGCDFMQGYLLGRPVPLEIILQHHVEMPCTSEVSE